MEKMPEREERIDGIHRHGKIRKIRKEEGRKWATEGACGKEAVLRKLKKSQKNKWKKCENLRERMNEKAREENEY